MRRSVSPSRSPRRPAPEINRTNPPGQTINSRLSHEKNLVGNAEHAHCRVAQRASQHTLYEYVRWNCTRSQMTGMPRYAAPAVPKPAQLRDCENTKAAAFRGF